MSEETKTINVTGGIGFLSMMFLIFMTLKLIGYINWSWWWVTAPLWGPWALGISLLLGVIILAFVAVLGRRIWLRLTSNQNVGSTPPIPPSITPEAPPIFQNQQDAYNYAQGQSAANSVGPPDWDQLFNEAESSRKAEQEPEPEIESEEDQIDDIRHIDLE